MKKSVTLIYLFLFCLSALPFLSCKKSIPANETPPTNEALSQLVTDVNAYYFHATRRCATCQAVESVTKETLEEYYGNKVTFQSINIDEAKERSLIEAYKISGQTLLIVKGGQIVNLTNEAFMTARSDPDKLKATIKKTIDSMI